MKNSKKFAAMIAALTLSACSIAPMFSFAATNPDITATAPDATADGSSTFELSLPDALDGKKISNVTAYKIFDITTDEDNTTTYAWAVGDTAKAALTEAAKAKAGAEVTDVVTALSKLTDATTFAKVAAKNLTDGKTGTVNGTVVDFGEALETGYYVVTCEAVGEDNDADEENVNKNKSVSLGMLTLVDGTNKEIGLDGVAKVSLPSVQKKVLEDDGAATEAAQHESGTDSKQWNDGADWAIGQTKSFKLYGTLPDNFAKYDTYYYEFHDSLATQFVAPDKSTFKVSVVNKGVATELESGYTVTVTAGTTTNHTISVVFDDLKQIAGVDKDSIITVQYNTALNATANVGSAGQENEVYLEYSNNPNKSGSGDNGDENEHGETPKDKVIVFTYALEFEKKFFGGTTPLTDEEIFKGEYANLTFTLKDDANKPVKVVPYTGTDGKYDYVIVDADSTDEKAITALPLVLVDKDGNVITDEIKAGWTSKADVPTDAKLVIRIKGLDSGEYKIDEDASISDFEYNTVTDVKVDITSGVKYQQEWNDGVKTEIYKEITYKFDETNGTVNKTGTADGIINNTKGVALPSTGGVGATIFYLGGGAMVAVAGVYLITKKRMGKSEN